MIDSTCTRGPVLAVIVALALAVVPGATGQSPVLLERKQLHPDRQSPLQSPAAEDTVEGTILGDPLSGITAAEFERFRLGLEDFLEIETPDEGLGPVFNGRGCSECHSIPAIGGSGTILELRAGILRANGDFESLPGGSIFHLFSIPPHEVQARVPAAANSVAMRKSLQLFGLGLVEAVPDAVLIALADPKDRDGDGVRGRAARVIDIESGDSRVGRFGWKAQQATLMAFGAEAYRDEMGITNELFPLELCPAGVDCELLDFVDTVRDPEDVPERATGLRGIDNFESFMLFLGPPPRGEITAEVAAGEEVFRQIGCGACHVPQLETGDHESEAIAFKRFFPYGDFLLHDVGTGDGIGQADARPNELRTPPLWGLRFRGPLLHDGRASTMEEAIFLHSVEGERSKREYRALSSREKSQLRRFLRSL